MLPLVVDYGVPATLFLLMLIAGTEVGREDLASLQRHPRAVLLGSAGQLLLLPLVALLIITLSSPLPAIAVGMLLLTLSPGGGISNYYCYLGRCNILLSATITTAGAVLSLFTIPLWLKMLPALPAVGDELPTVPAGTIIGQLLVLMILPMAIGAFLRHLFPATVEGSRRRLRWLSLGVLALVLGLTLWSVREALVGLAGEILISSVKFILAAMAVGWLLGLGLHARDRAVLVMESGVRNIAVALILGSALLSIESFGIFVSFLTGYFVAEVAIMLTYARYLQQRVTD